MIDMIINMTGGLIAVIMLIFLLAFIYKKNQRHSSGIMSIKQYLSLGPKRGFAAIKIGSEIMIVGITPSGFNLLKTYDEKDLPPMDFKKFVDNESMKQDTLSNVGDGGAFLSNIDKLRAFRPSLKKGEPKDQNGEK